MDAAMTRVQVIFLNGVSSSGKTTIARALQHRLTDVYFHIQLDTFIDSLPSKIRQARNWHKEVNWTQLITGFHRAVRAFVCAGNGVILDHVCEDQSWLYDCASVLKDVTVLLVGVRCSLAELERRELARQDRRPSKAKDQYYRVHAHSIYDVEVDTSKMSVFECAAEIERAINSGIAPVAFERLRQQGAFPLNVANFRSTDV